MTGELWYDTRTCSPKMWSGRAWVTMQPIIEPKPPSRLRPLIDCAYSIANFIVYCSDPVDIQDRLEFEMIARGFVRQITLHEIIFELEEDAVLWRLKLKN